jgi:hypothetical protein
MGGNTSKPQPTLICISEAAKATCDTDAKAVAGFSEKITEIEKRERVNANDTLSRLKRLAAADASLFEGQPDGLVGLIDNYLNRSTLDKQVEPNTFYFRIADNLDDRALKENPLLLKANPANLSQSYFPTSNGWMSPGSPKDFASISEIIDTRVPGARQIGIQ